jgi:hypothetical protein
VSSFDVRVFAIRRRPGRKTFEVRWRVAGRDRSRSFMTRALADSYRAELVRTARTGLAWTNTGKSHEPTGLKHRPDGAIRVVPIPPVLVSMLCHHLGDHGTTPHGRLFRGARGGILSESVYGRAWHAARRAALGPDLAATALARRPYDLRHAALSLWLNATGAPAEVAARADNSARVLHEVYTHCTDGQEDTVSQRIEDALDAGTGITHSSPRAKASGYTHRRHRPGPCLSVREPARSPAHGPRKPGPAAPAARHAGARSCARFRSSEAILIVTGPMLADGRIQPTHSPRTHPTV